MQHSFAVWGEYKHTATKGFDRRDGVNSSSNIGRVVVVVVVGTASSDGGDGVGCGGGGYC